MRETLYLAPVLSQADDASMGIYCAYHTLEKYIAGDNLEEGY